MRVKKKHSEIAYSQWRVLRAHIIAESATEENVAGLATWTTRDEKRYDITRASSNDNPCDLQEK